MCNQGGTLGLSFWGGPPKGNLAGEYTRFDTVRQKWGPRPYGVPGNGGLTPPGGVFGGLREDFLGELAP